MCDQNLWLPTWQLLTQQCHEDVQFIPLVIPTSGSMDDIVRAMANNMVAEQAILVGFSLGGYLASAIALRLGDRLKQLLVLSNCPKNLPSAEIKQRQRTLAWIKQRGYAGIPKKRVDDLLHPDIQQFNSNGYQEIKQTIIAMDQTLGVKVLLQQLAVSVQRPNLLPALAKLNLPISFMVGDADNLVVSAELKKACAGTDNMKLINVANTGHMLPLEAPQALASVLHGLITDSDILLNNSAQE